MFAGAYLDTVLRDWVSAKAGQLNSSELNPRTCNICMVTSDSTKGVTTDMLIPGELAWREKSGGPPDRILLVGRASESEGESLPLRVSKLERHNSAKRERVCKLFTNLYGKASLLGENRASANIPGNTI
ncbi:hypothetical protein FKM82_026266 [Ascaphus truei]